MRCNAWPSQNQARLNGANKSGAAKATPANASATTTAHIRICPPDHNGQTEMISNTDAKVMPNDLFDPGMTFRCDDNGSWPDISSPDPHTCLAPNSPPSAWCCS